MLVNSYRFTPVTPPITDASWGTPTAAFTVSTTAFTNDTVNTVNAAGLQRIQLDTFTFNNTDTNVQFWLDWTGGNLLSNNGAYICCMRTDIGTTSSWNTGNSYGYFSTGYAWGNAGAVSLSFPLWGDGDRWTYPGAPVRLKCEVNAGSVSFTRDDGTTVFTDTFALALGVGTFTFMMGQTDPAGTGATFQIIRARKD